MTEQQVFNGWHPPTGHTQIPNELLDNVMADLGLGELKVLLYIMRRTFGFQRSSDNISIAQICDGITGKGCVQLDRGTGLSKNSVHQAIKSLIGRGMIVATRRYTADRQGLPSSFSLRWDTATGMQNAPAEEIDPNTSKLDAPIQVTGGTPHPSSLEYPHPSKLYPQKKEDRIESLEKERPELLRPSSGVSYQQSLIDQPEDISTVHAARSLPTFHDALDKPPPTAAEQRNIEAAAIFEYYRSKIQPTARLPAKAQIVARLKKWSAADLREAIDNFAADPWWMDKNGRRGAEWFFKSDARIEQLRELGNPNVVRGANKNGTPSNAETIRNPGYDPRAVHLTAQQRAHAEAMAKKYPNLKT